MKWVLCFSRCWQAAVLLLVLTAAASAPTPTLRQAADRAGLLVGAAVRPSLFREAAYSETLSREFNMIEPEDVMKWWVLRRNPNDQILDTLVF